MTDFDVGCSHSDRVAAAAEMTAIALPDTFCCVCRFWVEQGDGWGYCQAQVRLAEDTLRWEHPEKHASAPACPQFERIGSGEEV